MEVTTINQTRRWTDRITSEEKVRGVTSVIDHKDGEVHVGESKEDVKVFSLEDGAA